MPLAEQPFSYTRPDGATLRGRYLPGDQGLLVFLPGFRSVYTGAKAGAFCRWAEQAGMACLRVDHFAHGTSDGDFDDFRISAAVADAAGYIGEMTDPAQPLYLVGSSMGAWIALTLCAQQQLSPDGLLLIAPAVDFVSRRKAELPPEARTRLETVGHVEVPDRYQAGQSYRISNDFLADALALEVDEYAPLSCPVRIVHGDRDESVPVATARRLATQLTGSILTEIPAGDHRLAEHVPLLLEQFTRLRADST